MGILSKRFWRSDKDTFACLVRDEIASAGEIRPIHYDKATFTLRIGAASLAESPPTIFLQNVFLTYMQLQEVERPAALKRIVASFIEGNRPVPDNFAAAADHLLPLVRPMVELSTWQLQCKARGVLSDAAPPRRQITPSMAAWLAFDRDESIRWVAAEQLGKWAVSIDAALDIAVTNLRRRSLKPFANLSPGLYAADWADTYGSSRLLLIELFTSLSVRGAPIAMAPNRDVLLVTGSEDEAGLRSMVLHGRKALAEPRPPSACTLKLEGSAWQEFVPDPSEPGYADLVELQEHQASRDYAEQKKLLDEINKKAGVDIFVAHGAVVDIRHRLGW